MDQCNKKSEWNLLKKKTSSDSNEEKNIRYLYNLDFLILIPRSDFTHKCLDDVTKITQQSGRTNEKTIPSFIERDKIRRKLYIHKDKWFSGEIA